MINQTLLKQTNKKLCAKRGIVATVYNSRITKKLMQVNHRFKASLSCIARLSEKTKTKQKGLGMLLTVRLSMQRFGFKQKQK